MADFDVPLTRSGFGQTARADNWWVQPLLTFLGFAAFIAYSTWAAFQGVNYRFGPYLSPFYSPELWGNSGQAIFGPIPSWLPAWFTAAFFILWAPGGFRFTCYYYRGAYYKAWWADPPNCTVGEPRHSYWGERTFPLIIQNIHRYFLYIAIIFIAILAHDAIVSYSFNGHFGIGVGTIVLTIDPILLGCYTFGCHSLRHLVGGIKDRLSGSPVRKKTYDCVSCLNRRHMLFAWCSLFWVGFTDFYVRMCAMGVFHDWRLL